MKGQIETKTTLDQNLTYTSLFFFSNPLFQLTPYLEIDIYKKNTFKIPQEVKRG